MIVKSQKNRTESVTRPETNTVAGTAIIPETKKFEKLTSGTERSVAKSSQTSDDGVTPPTTVIVRATRKWGLSDRSGGSQENSISFSSFHQSDSDLLDDYYEDLLTTGNDVISDSFRRNS